MFWSNSGFFSSYEGDAFDFETVNFILLHRMGTWLANPLRKPFDFLKSLLLKTITTIMRLVWVLHFPIRLLSCQYEIYISSQFCVRWLSLFLKYETGRVNIICRVRKMAKIQSFLTDNLLWAQASVSLNSCGYNLIG